MAYNSAPSVSPAISPWEQRWGSMTHSSLWFFSLLGLGSLGSLVYPHAPLAGFAIAAGTTLPLKKGLIAMTAIWLVNQAIGFGWRGYPLTVEALTWGAVMVLGSWIVLMLASLRPSFSRQSWRGHFVWVALSLCLGFGLYQSTILLGGWLMGSTHQLPLPVLAKLFRKELVATALLSGLYGLLAAQKRNLASS